MLLVYYKTCVTSTLAGFLFDLDQSNVLKDIRMLEPLVREWIPIPKKVYEGARRARTPEEVEKFYPGFMAMIDSTEQEIPRPKRDAKKRKSHYPGKKKRHTVKMQLAVNEKGLIVHRPNHARGRRHDYDIFKGNRPKLPEGVRPRVDLGYDGIKKDFPELDALIPFKRRGGKGKKGRALTPSQKRFNKLLPKARVEDEEVPHHGGRVQEQVEAVRRDDGLGLRTGQPQDNGNDQAVREKTKSQRGGPAWNNND